jgi:hypothetical protein
LDNGVCSNSGIVHGGLVSSYPRGLIFAFPVVWCDEGLGHRNLLQQNAFPATLRRPGKNGLISPSELKNSAAPQAAAYIFQLERALYHLSRAEAGVSVAVEVVDDVSLHRADGTFVQEQDKHSTDPNKELLGDRSKALWRTLQIWTTQRSNDPTSKCERYLLVTNTVAAAGIVSSIKKMASGHSNADDVIGAMRTCGAIKSRAKIQEVINDVLGHSDQILKDIVSRIEIVDSIARGASYSHIANGLAIDPRMDTQAITDGLLGWLTRALRTAWEANQPGIISRAACVRQCRELERLQARQRFLPRAARDVIVAEADRSKALARPFVDHLNRIEAEEEDVLQAIEHFVQFNVEKHRLTNEGEIADREWRDRSDRLIQRWKNICLASRRALRGSSNRDIGQKILIDSTYDHMEPLADQPCNELYMTSGHYHRLADDDEIWWDPAYNTEAAQ